MVKFEFNVCCLQQDYVSWEDIVAEHTTVLCQLQQRAQANSAVPVIRVAKNTTVLFSRLSRMLVTRG